MVPWREGASLPSAGHDPTRAFAVGKSCVSFVIGVSQVKRNSGPYLSTVLIDHQMLLARLKNDLSRYFEPFDLACQNEARDEPFECEAELRKREKYSQPLASLPPSIARNSFGSSHSIVTRSQCRATPIQGPSSFKLAADLAPTMTCC